MTTTATPAGKLATRPAGESRLAALAGELLKLPAFIRRDFLDALSYRLAFFSDWAGLIAQTAAFYFVGLMVDPAKIPEFGGSRVTYLEFVSIGIIVGTVFGLGVARMTVAIRTEQMRGTLEYLLTTPTAIPTIQLGSVMYSLIYVPIRTALFFTVIAVAFGLDFSAGGVLPAFVILAFFVPFVWGLGIFSAAATLTFKRGSGWIGLGTGVLTMLSGAYFPLDLLPDWVSSVAKLNPIAITIDGMREALLAGTGWSGVGTTLLVLAPLSTISLALGILAFRAALRRERRLGTLGLY